MKEIKYRTWDKELNNWADHNQQLSEVSVSASVNPPSVLTIGKDRYELMLFTGLKDMNGKGIYEGDILKDKHGLGEVKWIQEHCAFMVSTSEPSQYHFLESDGQLKDSEVWGNVFDNPDWDF
jgi:uncharacterized phage protein (TIGR01671 family)